MIFRSVHFRNEMIRKRDMKYYFTKTFIGLLISLLMLSNSWATIINERRVALVIGNGEYENVPSLLNAKNDSRLIKKTLQSINFEVIYIEDASAAKIDRKTREFSNKLKEADVGLFYYAGHAIQYEGNNFLIPTDLLADSDEVSAKYDAVNVNMIIDRMKKAKNPTNIIILDACRDNPFAASSRSLTRGLAPINASANGMFFAYSTSPGDVATDGNGNNSPFTMALSKYITKPGITIHDVFTDVKVDVSRQTNNRQRPWTTDSLLGKFYFAGAKDPSEIKRSVELEKLKAESEKLKRELELARQIATKAKTPSQKLPIGSSKQSLSIVSQKAKNDANLINSLEPEVPTNDKVDSQKQTLAAINRKQPAQDHILKLNEDCHRKYTDLASTRSTRKTIYCFKNILGKYPNDENALKNLQAIADYYEKRIKSKLLRKEYSDAESYVEILILIDIAKAYQYSQQIDEQKVKISAPKKLDK